MTGNYPPASGISASACQLPADWPAGGFPGSIPAGQGETAPGTPGQKKPARPRNPFSARPRNPFSGRVPTEMLFRLIGPNGEALATIQFFKDKASH